MNTFSYKFLAILAASIVLAACSKEEPTIVPTPPETVTPAPKMPAEPVAPVESIPETTPPVNEPVTPPSGSETEVK